MGLLVPTHGYVGPASLIDALVRAGHCSRRVDGPGSRDQCRADSIRCDRDCRGKLVGGARENAAATREADSRATAVAVDGSPACLARHLGDRLLHRPLDRRERRWWARRSKTSASTSGRPLGLCEAAECGGGPDAGLERAQFRDARAGFRPKTADELPAIGRSSTMPHVFYAAGHCANGVLLAPLTASLIADLVLDGRERPELADVRPERLGL